MNNHQPAPLRRNNADRRLLSKKPQPGFAAFLALALPLLLSACSSTHIHSTRAPAALTTPPLRSMMVVAMDERPEVRYLFENNAVNRLAKFGVQGTTSCSRYSLAQMKTQMAVLGPQLQASGIAAILRVQMAGRTTFVSGPPASLGDLSAGAAEESVYEAFTATGGEAETDVGLGARVFRTSDGALVWSAMLDFIQKEDDDEFTEIRHAADRIVDQLAKDKVIP